MEFKKENILKRKKKAGFTLAEVLITLGVIGVVAAITIPGLMSAYQKHVVETRLKQSYSLLSQVVKLATVDYDDPSGWDTNLNTEDFANTYIVPYLKSDMKRATGSYGNSGDHFLLTLLNGTEWKIYRHAAYAPTSTPGFIFVTVDINGPNKPNAQGRDRFNFYILPEARYLYNAGNGDVAHNVPSAGVYYDGYGFSDNDIKNYQWRGCRNAVDNDNYPTVGSFCVAMIAKNSWKIPKDYPIKF